jgi:hypothetical protein
MQWDELSAHFSGKPDKDSEVIRDLGACIANS